MDAGYDHRRRFLGVLRDEGVMLELTTREAHTASFRWGMVNIPPQDVKKGETFFEAQARHEVGHRVVPYAPSTVEREVVAKEIAESEGITDTHGFLNVVWDLMVDGRNLLKTPGVYWDYMEEYTAHYLSSPDPRAKLLGEVGNLLMGRGSGDKTAKKVYRLLFEDGRSYYTRLREVARLLKDTFTEVNEGAYGACGSNPTPMNASPGEDAESGQSGQGQEESQEDESGDGDEQGESSQGDQGRQGEESGDEASEGEQDGPDSGGGGQSDSGEDEQESESGGESGSGEAPDDEAGEDESGQGQEESQEESQEDESGSGAGEEERDTDQEDDEHSGSTAGGEEESDQEDQGQMGGKASGGGQGESGQEGQEQQSGEEGSQGGVMGGGQQEDDSKREGEKPTLANMANAVVVPDMDSEDIDPVELAREMLQAGIDEEDLKNRAKDYGDLYRRKKLAKVQKKLSLMDTFVEVTDKVGNRPDKSEVPDTWRVGDDPSTLDLTDTLQRHGMVVPGVTTVKKGEGAMSGGGKAGSVMLIMDVSGSTGNAPPTTNKPVIETIREASFCVAETARRNGDLLGAVTFSSTIVWEKGMTNTEQEIIVDGIVDMEPMNMTNVLKPAIWAREQTRDLPHETTTFLITDGQIHDLENAMEVLEELNDQGRLVVFLITERGADGNLPPQPQELVNRGFTVYMIEAGKDFSEEALEEVERGEKN